MRNLNTSKSRKSASAGTPVLSISGLGIQRDGLRILNDVSWEVRSGQHWVILGANGSGKTSLLSALTGYFMPTEGEMKLLGRKFGESDWRQLRTRIGLVSSSIRQLMHELEPAIETVASGKWGMIDLWRTVSRSDLREAARILELVKCRELRDRPWGVLSQGERQRVLIARALMSRPKLLILDEPCAGLDPAAREHFLGFLQRLARGPGKNAPLVLVTHHVEEIMPVFTHVLMISKGSVLAAGPIDDLLTAKNLGDLFGSKVALRRTQGRFQLSVSPIRKGVM